jgi:hypothetical protein
MRVEGWERILHLFFEKHRNQRFIRGNIDCGLFVASGINLIQGRKESDDSGKKYRLKYKNKKELRQLMKVLGHKDLIDVANEVLGAPYKSIKNAKRGDCVLVPCDEGAALALVDLTGKIALTTGKNDLVRYPMNTWLMAWEV